MKKTAAAWALASLLALPSLAQRYKPLYELQSEERIARQQARATVIAALVLGGSMTVAGLAFGYAVYKRGSRSKEN